MSFIEWLDCELVGDRVVIFRRADGVNPAIRVRADHAITEVFVPERRIREDYGYDPDVELGAFSGKGILKFLDAEMAGGIELVMCRRPFAGATFGTEVKRTVHETIIVLPARFDWDDFKGITADRNARTERQETMLTACSAG
jgi:hypothetical protein